MVVTIKWYDGSMEICVDEFLSMRKIGKYKKLIKLIRSSRTPEVEKDIKSYMERQIPDYEERLTNTANAYAAMVDKVKEHESLLERYKRELEFLCPGSPRHKDKKEDMKSERDAVRYWKIQAADDMKKFTKYQKEKNFYEKCLEIEG